MSDVRRSLLVQTIEPSTGGGLAAGVGIHDVVLLSQVIDQEGNVMVRD